MEIMEFLSHSCDLESVSINTSLVSVETYADRASRQEFQEFHFDPKVFNICKKKLVRFNLYLVIFQPLFRLRFILHLGDLEKRSKNSFKDRGTPLKIDWHSRFNVKFLWEPKFALSISYWKKA
ncbi:hypothetical protein N665_0425s0002 [Sinapis alba]|nr:hypothetical protein N665_0425s0002 [Sinapis alba]